MSATYKGVGGWRGVLTLPVDTADQAMCPAGQRDGYSSPWQYHKLSRHRVEQDWTQNYPIDAPQWPHRVCFSPSWLDKVSKKPFVKSRPVYNSSFVTVSGQCLSVTINGFQFLCIHGGFCKSSHICTYVVHRVMCTRSDIKLISCIASLCYYFFTAQLANYLFIVFSFSYRFQMQNASILVTWFLALALVVLH